jgi:hypothetical protein
MFFILPTGSRSGERRAEDPNPCMAWRSTYYQWTSAGQKIELIWIINQIAVRVFSLV